MTAKKEETKKPINFNKLKIKAAKYLAYATLVVTATYGVQQMLKSLDDIAKTGFTVVVMLILVTIISLNEE